MYAAKRPLLRPALFFFIIASFVLAACGTALTNQSWPGLTAAGDTLYVAYGPSVVAYDANTQAQKWSFPSEASAGLLFFAPPYVEGDRVYLGDYGASGGFFSPGVTVSIYALDESGGGAPQELWSNSELASDKIVAKPLVENGQLFVGTADNFIFALDAETNTPQWQVETGHSIWGQPVYRDGVLYVASLDRAVYALDAETGDELWRSELSGALPSRPVLDTNQMFVASFDKQIHALDLATGTENWAADADDWIWGAPAFSDGVVYYADIRGNVFAVDAENGAPRWRTQAIGAVQTSPVIEGDKLYVASEGLVSEEVTQGALTAYAIEDGRELWQATTPAPLFTTPVVVNDTIVVALQSEAALLIGFDLETGTQKWVIAPPAS